MAAGATIRTLSVTLSDVDRAVYESFELRVAQHPSEALPYLWSRILAYCLSFQEGIAFNAGGLSNREEPPVLVRSHDGRLHHWIEVGAPSAERLHKGSKAADNVALYSCASLIQLRRELGKKRVHRLEEIELWPLSKSLIDSLCTVTERSMQLELVRTEGQLFVTVDDRVFEAEIRMERLSSDG